MVQQAGGWTCKLPTFSEENLPIIDIILELKISCDG